MPRPPGNARAASSHKRSGITVVRGKQAKAVIPPQLVLPVQLREVHDILTQRRGIRALTVLLLQADRGTPSVRRSERMFPAPTDSS